MLELFHAFKVLKCFYILSYEIGENSRQLCCPPVCVSSKIESIFLAFSEMKCRQPKGDANPAVTVRIILS